MPRLCELYPAICLTTEEKARKNLSQVKKTLSHSTTKNTHTLQNPHKRTHYKTHSYTHTHIHTLQNNIKPPQYKLKRNAYSTQFLVHTESPTSEVRLNNISRSSSYRAVDNTLALDTRPLSTFRETIVCRCEIYGKNVSENCSENVEFLNVTARGINSYRCANYGWVLFM